MILSDFLKSLTNLLPSAVLHHTSPSCYFEPLSILHPIDEPLSKYCLVPLRTIKTTALIIAAALHCHQEVLSRCHLSTIFKTASIIAGDTTLRLRANNPTCHQRTNIFDTAALIPGVHNILWHKFVLLIAAAAARDNSRCSPDVCIMQRPIPVTAALAYCASIINYQFYLAASCSRACQLYLDIKIDRDDNIILIHYLFWLLISAISFS